MRVYTRTDPMQRFLAKVEIDAAGCWIWSGYKYRHGYAAFFPGVRRGQDMLAHRWAYEHWRGPIPDGHEIDHVCRVRCCVNPWHLQAVTHHENLRRAKWSRSALMKCPQGHDYDEANTQVNARGHRRCRICARDANRRSAERKRAAVGA